MDFNNQSNFVADWTEVERVLSVQIELYFTHLDTIQAINNFGGKYVPGILTEAMAQNQANGRPLTDREVASKCDAMRLTLEALADLYESGDRGGFMSKQWQPIRMMVMARAMKAEKITVSIDDVVALLSLADQAELDVYTKNYQQSLERLAVHWANFEGRYEVTRDTTMRDQLYAQMSKAIEVFKKHRKHFIETPAKERYAF